MDDVAEQQEIANEISEAISNPVGFGQDADEVRWYRIVRVWQYTKSSYILSRHLDFGICIVTRHLTNKNTLISQVS